jgi:endonuclease YncB( thermonuclease family)
MKNLIASLQSLFILVCFASLFISIALAQAPNCYIISVYDGDTFKAIYKGNVINCRLAMIDAPELQQAYGMAARDSLAAMIAGKTGVLTLNGEDKYHRQLVRLSINNKDVEEMMVLKGLAWLFNKDDILTGMETSAQLSNAGLWSCKKRIPPWQYRRLSKTAKAMFGRCDNG